MLNINIEFRKGILFVRLNGNLNKANIYRLTEDLNFKYIVFNINNLNSIDSYCINHLIEINNTLLENNGKLLICEKNSKSGEKLFKRIPKINSEIEAFNLFERINYE